MNNPISNADPSGHFAISTLILSVVISTIVNVGIEIYEDTHGQDKDAMDYVGAILGGAFSGAIGFGAIEAIKYATCLIGTGVGKLASKLFSNNKVNRLVTKAGFEGIKIGTKGIFKITKNLASVEGNIITDIFSGLGSGGYSWLENYFVTHVF